jgi:hypothetical protein
MVLKYELKLNKFAPYFVILAVLQIINEYKKGGDAFRVRNIRHTQPDFNASGELKKANLSKSEVNMNKLKIFPVLIAILSMVLVGSTAGCATAPPMEPIAKPTINSFAASPASIEAGQKTILSWDVSGADTVTIQPDIIGAVGSSGSLQLSPADTITYTLTATNEAGSTSGTATITVTPVVVSQPDLVITDIWLLTDVVHCKVKNQGDVEAKPTWVNLYVFDQEKTSSYVDALAPGEERTIPFSRWQWTFQAMPGTPLDISLSEAVDIKVCADAKNDIEETNKANNCTTILWGQPFMYDFTNQAHRATWRSSAEGVAGDITFGGIPHKNGAAYIYLGDLFMCPQQVKNGWILGRFADFYSEFGASQSREIEVPARAVFTAQLGYKQGATSTDGVRVALGYLDETFSLVLFPKMDVYSDGQLHTYKADLSALEDKKTEFFLWVEAKDSPEGDCVKWVNPKITQE